MPLFVTLQEIKDQLEIQGDSRNTELLSLGYASTQLVYDYCTNTDKVTWDNINVPPTVKAATLIVVAGLFANRGDGDTANTALPQLARDLLFNHHDPTCV